MKSDPSDKALRALLHHLLELNEFYEQEHNCPYVSPTPQEAVEFERVRRLLGYPDSALIEPKKPDAPQKKGSKGPPS